MSMVALNRVGDAGHKKPVQVKICGLRDDAMVDVALRSGADFIGFVFVPQSPRFITVDAAKPLIARCSGGRGRGRGFMAGAGSSI